MAERYPGKAGRSEYGGGDGVVQRYPDGMSLPLPEIAGSTAERAMLMRIAGANDFDPARIDEVGLALTARDVSTMSAAELELYEIDVARSMKRLQEREDLMARTNGYVGEPEQYVGEAGEGNGVPADAAGGNADPTAFGGTGQAL